MVNLFIYREITEKKNNNNDDDLDAGNDRDEVEAYDNSNAKFKDREAREINDEEEEDDVPGLDWINSCMRVNQTSLSDMPLTLC